MKMDKYYDRRIRIVSKPFALSGHMLKVADVESGEDIDNIFHIDISLDARGLNQAVIRYHPYDTEDKIVLNENHDPCEEVILIKDPEIDIMALEVHKFDQE
jgi:hypothetical protein